MNSSDKTYDILTFGDLCVDLIVSGIDITPHFGQVEKLMDDYVLEMGGSCSIFACQAARLGMRVGILGRVGRDDFGRLVLQRLNEAGVDTRHVIVDPTMKTGMGIALCQQDDRAILTYPGTLCALRPEDVTDDILASARHLHHGSYFLQTGLRPHMADIFQRAHTLGLSISLDTNWDPDEQWNGGLQSLLPLVDVLMPNEQEALRITHQGELINAVNKLQTQGISLITVKRGAQGARIFSDQEMLEKIPLPAAPGGDSIGAGDSFDAGFLTGWLRGLPLNTCLDIGIACGRAVAQAVGGVAGQLTWNQVLER